MNSNSNKPYWLPVFLAIAMVIGMLIGNFLPRQVNTVTEKMPNEIAEVLQVINTNYMDTVNNTELMNDAIRGLLKGLDPHSTFETAEENRQFMEEMNNAFEGIGVQFHLQNDSLLVVDAIAEGPSEKAGVCAGDRITKVNGKNITNIGLKNEDVFKMLRGPKNSKVNIEIYRPFNHRTYQFSIIRDVIPTYSIIASYMMNSHTGYIRLTQFSATTSDEIATTLEKLKKEGMTKLILDLRSNSGGFLDAGIKVADEFLQKGLHIVYTEGLRQEKKAYYASKYGHFEKGDLVVLIDEFSASAAEIVAGAIQDNDRGTVIGRRSFGKGLVQQQFPLESGNFLKLTVARYHTPTGRCIQRPYEDGIEKYYNDFVERLLQGNADSVKIDTQYRYTTPKGKIVYGGGGITPDIFVPLDTTSKEQPNINDMINSGRENFYRKLNRNDKTILKALEILK